MATRLAVGGLRGQFRPGRAGPAEVRADHRAIAVGAASDAVADRDFDHEGAEADRQEDVPGWPDRGQPAAGVVGSGQSGDEPEPGGQPEPGNQPESGAEPDRSSG
jgi:hypothetical protein